MRTMTGRAAGLGALAVLGGLLPGCFSPPPGEAPLRYRDELPGKTVSVTRDVVYSTAQDGVANNLALDVYRPTPDSVTKRPAIVVVHGGGFKEGDKTRAKAVALATAFAKRGYVAASINYRLLNDTEPIEVAAVAAQHDAQAAIRFLRKRATTYGIDSERVAITGTSAGAGTALLVAVNAEDPGSSGSPLYSSAVRASMPISGAIGPNQRPAFREVLDQDDAPTLLFYGTEDTLVTPDNVKATAAEMNEFGNVAFLQPVEGGHVPFTPEAQHLYYTQGVYFLYKYLDLANAAQ